MTRNMGSESEMIKVFVYGKLKKGGPLTLESKFRSYDSSPPEVVEGVETVKKYAIYHLGHEVGIKAPKTEREKKYAKKIVGDVFTIHKSLYKFIMSSHFNFFDFSKKPSTYKKGRIKVRMPNGAIEEVATFFVNSRFPGLEVLPLVEDYDPNGWVCHLYSDKLPDLDTLQFLANHEYKGKKFSEIVVLDGPLSMVARERSNPKMELWNSTPLNLYDFKEMFGYFIENILSVGGDRKVFLFLGGNPAIKEAMARYIVAVEGREVLIPSFNEEGKICGVEPHPFCREFRTILEGVREKAEKLRNEVPSLRMRDLIWLYKKTLSREVYDFIRGRGSAPDLIGDVVREYLPVEHEREQLEAEATRSLEL